MRSMKTMEKVFKQPDILADVLSYLDPDLYPFEKKKQLRHSLHSAALTNRAWSETALDVLWGSSPVEAYHLLVLLGEMSRKPDRLEPKIQNYYFKYKDLPLTPERWARFIFYARRIRHLSIGTGHRRLEQDVYTYVALHVRDGSPFPNLRRVDWDGTGPSHIAPYLSTCIYWLTSVQELCCTLPAKREQSSVYSFSAGTEAYHLRRCGLKLNALELRGRWGADGILQLIQKQDLRDINMQVLIGFTPDHFKKLVRHLGHLASLKRLVIEIAFEYKSDPPENVECPLQLGTFQALETLEVTSDLSILSLPSILGIQSAPERLAEVCFHAKDTKTESQALDLLCKTISTRFGSVSRIELIVETKHSESNCKHLAFSSISCLAEMRSIEKFVLRHSHPPDISRLELDSLLSAWPALRVLKISRNQGFEGSCGLDTSPKWIIGDLSLGLSILDTFAIRCPQMEELEMPFNDTSPSVIPGVPRLEHLRSLTQVHSANIDADKTALYLFLRTPVQVVIQGPDEKLNPCGEASIKAWRDIPTRIAVLRSFWPVLQPVGFEIETTASQLVDDRT